MLVDTFDDHCDTDLHTLQYHLLEHVVDDMRKFVPFFVLGSSS